MVVVNISRSRKARIMAKPRPSAEVVEKTDATASAGPSRIDTIKSEYWGRQAIKSEYNRLASAGPAIVAEVVAFVPMPPITPPPDHLRRELTPKLGSGAPKHLGSPPEKKGRMQ